MAEFHETRMGQEFYLKNFPKLVKEMGRIADALENNNTLPAVQNDTLYCQKVDEKTFADALSEISNGNVSVGYFSKSIPMFRSKNPDKELCFDETAPYLKKVMQKIIGKEVKDVENINARCGFVYIAFTIN